MALKEGVDVSEMSNKILELIEQQRLSYSELSEITGIPKSSLQKYATGQTEKIPLDRLERLASALGVTSAYLIGWEDKAVAPEPASKVTDEDIKYALFGGADNVTDEMYDEVKRFAAYIKARESN